METRLKVRLHVSLTRRKLFEKLLCVYFSIVSNGFMSKQCPISKHALQTNSCVKTNYKHVIYKFVTSSGDSVAQW